MTGSHPMVEPPLPIMLHRYLLFLLVLLLVPTCSGQVRVRGHFRRDGTYVTPHYRSTPDGSPFNNYSYPGNLNPYTGRVAAGDPLKYLERYYTKQPLHGTRGSSTLSGPYPRGLDLDVSGLLRFPEALPPEDVDRVSAYCTRLFDSDAAGRARCQTGQIERLAVVAIPDYARVGTKEADLLRSSRYCENLYGDDRAGFYNCLNFQVLRLSRPGPPLEAVASSSDADRSRRYCEQLYGDDRGGFTSCMSFQADRLGRASAFRFPSWLPDQEVQRSTRYCERLYGNDRGGYASCMNFQAERLARYNVEPGEVPQNEWGLSVQYCERLYGDDRGGAASCRIFQAERILGAVRSGLISRNLPQAAVSPLTAAGSTVPIEGVTGVACRIKLAFDERAKGSAKAPRGQTDTITWRFPPKHRSRVS